MVLPELFSKPTQWMMIPAFFAAETRVMESQLSIHCPSENKMMYLFHGVPLSVDEKRFSAAWRPSDMSVPP